MNAFVLNCFKFLKDIQWQRETSVIVVLKNRMILFLAIDTSEDEHSRKYTRGIKSTKKWIVKNVFRVPPVLGSTVKILEKAMVLSKGSFIGLLKVISGLFR